MSFFLRVFLATSVCKAMGHIYLAPQYCMDAWDWGWKKEMPLSPALSRSWIQAGKQREQRAGPETLLLLHLLLSLGLLILTLAAG